MKLLSPPWEADYWLGEPIYEENQSVGFHRMWYLDVLAQETDFQISMQSLEGYFTKREHWSRFDHEKKLHAYIIHRTLLDHEIVFDFDAENYEENVHNFKTIYPLLKKKGFIPYIWYSGNKGLHAHFFLSYKPLVKELDMELQELIVSNIPTKKLFLKRFTSYIARSLEWFYKSFAIDGQLNHTNHLIRAEGSLHTKSGYFKTFLGHTPEDIPLVVPVISPENKEYPRFPFHHYCYTESKIKYSVPVDIVKLAKEFIRSKKYHQQEVKQVTLSSFWERPEPTGDKNCVKFFESEDFGKLETGRKRALFILASHYKDQTEQMQVLKEWNEKILNGYLQADIISASARSTSGKVGCKYIQELLRSIGHDRICKGCTYSK